MTDRTVQVGGDANGAVITTGDHNKIYAVPKITMPEPHAVDIQRALGELITALGELSIAQPRKLNNALEEAQEEIEQAQPDKVEVAESLARAAKIAKEAESFASHSEKLVERFTPVLGWLGPHATRVAEALGMAI
ncbi:hypothetical protein [Pseudoalteromonas ardens]|uniref:Uncharacterized protein n=1 Tax=Pseudoalteromonas rubra TaxID=43658 RepID=A0A0L0ESI6_9GAMM|nr:hypothetical protein [Pseudoalteromonas sp. R96]KNC67442.1 hypothetical protein AC626_10705 [Pseudoalteromonas rubra]MDK1310079.1 hypothetical protein [Pseudoalteromonas sp. R96]